MLKYRTIFLILFYLLLKGQLSWAQLGVSNLAIISNQATQISQAVQLLKQTQTVIEQGNQSAMQLVQIRQFMEQTANDVKSLNTIKDLKINDLPSLLSKLLCIKDNNRYISTGPYLQLSAQLQASLDWCDHSQLYANSISGLSLNYDVPNTSVSSSAQNGAPRDAFDQQLYVAAGYQQVGQAYNSQTKFELAFKYKSLSDQLMAISQELSAALNIEGADMINANKPERLQLMALAVDYQLKALEYEEKYAQLLNESTATNPVAKSAVNQINRNFSFSEILQFRQ